MNGKARNFIPALANYNEQSWTLHNIMCRVSNWMGWNDNNTVLSRAIGRSDNLEGQFLIKSILKETVFTSIPIKIKIYRDGLGGNCLSFTPTPVLTALITGRNYFSRKISKERVLAKNVQNNRRKGSSWQVYTGFFFHSLMGICRYEYF